MNKLLIIHSSIRLTNIQSLIKDMQATYWIPFVTNYKKILDLNKFFSGIISKKDINSEIQSVAKKNRRQFLEITAKMAMQFNSIAWWANRISERDTMTNKLFLYCCYTVIADNHLSQNKNLIIVCESNMLIENIARLAIQKGYDVKRKKKLLEPKESIFYSIGSGFYNLLRKLYCWVLTKLNNLYYKIITEGTNPDNPEVIIHTWVDEKCFEKDGNFHDRYFTILPEFYRKNGLKVSTFVTLYNIKRSYWSAISFFRKNVCDFIIPEDYYKLYDFLFPFYIWLKRFKFKFKSVFFDDVDCTLLFKQNNKFERINFTTMYYLLFKRLAQKGITPQIVIDGFENMISDKMINLGVRKFMTDSLVYGFCHSTLPPNILCLFIDRSELGFAPLPDRIICNGKRFKDILVHEHYPEESIRIGTALRYHYLYNIKKISQLNKNRKFTILLALPLERGSALELFYKVTETIKGIDDCYLLIKPHPMGTHIFKTKNDLPLQYEVIEGSIKDVVNRCDIVITAASSVAIDFLMSDKEVIRVGNDTQIDFDPLAWFKEFGNAIYDVQRLREKIIELKGAIKSGTYRKPSYSSMLPELFLPATEENMKPFLPPSYN